MSEPTPLPENAPRIEHVDQTVEQLLQQAPSYCTVGTSESGGAQVLEFRDAGGIGCMAALAAVFLAMAGGAVWGALMTRVLYLRIVLGAVLLGLLYIVGRALWVIAGTLWARAIVRLEGSRVVVDHTLLGRTRNTVTTDMRGVDAISVRQSRSDGRVSLAQVSLLGHGAQKLAYPVTEEDTLWFCRLLAARYGVQLRVVDEEEGATLQAPREEPRLAASAGEGSAAAAEAGTGERVQESLRDLAQQAPANVEVTLRPGGNGAVLECADSGCLFLLLPLAVAWLLALGGLVWLVTSTSSVGGKIGAGWVALCLVFFGWKLPRLLIWARWGSWRLTIERHRVRCSPLSRPEMAWNKRVFRSCGGWNGRSP